MIPKIIHQTWKDNNIPTDIYKDKWVSSWYGKHGDNWKFYFWTDETIQRETEKHRPDLLPILEMSGVAKSQVCRFLAMELYGGLYVDLDYECFRPFDNLLNQSFLFTYALTGYKYVSDALLMAAPGQGFYHKVMDECLIRFEQEKWAYQHIEGMLSFIMLTDMVQKYGLREYIQEAESFSPFNWTKGEAAAQGTTETQFEEILKKYPYAYAATYWTHNW